MQVCAVQDHVLLIKNAIALPSAESLKIQRPERLQFTQSWGYSGLPELLLIYYWGRDLSNLPIFVPSHFTENGQNKAQINRSWGKFDGKK